MTKPENGEDDKSSKKEKEFNIIVNGESKVVTLKEMSFAQIVALEFEYPPREQNVCFTVTYRRGEGNKPEGVLVEGDYVKIKEGMVFNVAKTDKS